MRLLMMKGIVQLLQHFHFFNNDHNNDHDDKDENDNNKEDKKEVHGMKKSNQRARILRTL